MKISVDRITVKKRIRKNIGDIGRLKSSIQRVGLINPITVSEKYVLIAGFRRLEAVKQLGWKEIDCHVIKPASKLESIMIEADENNQRKDFTVEEKQQVEQLIVYNSTGFLGKALIHIKDIWKKIRALAEKIINSFNRK